MCFTHLEYYQLKTDWEIRVPALYLIWNTICLTCILSQVHTKNVITHGISFWRFKNLNLISGIYVWERFPKSWDWRLSHRFYASITLLFSLTIFLGRELKIMRYTLFNLNFLTKWHLGYIYFHINCLDFILLCTHLWILLRVYITSSQKYQYQGPNNQKWEKHWVIFCKMLKAGKM